MTEVTFDVTEIHAEMLEESRDIAGDEAINDSVENFIHDLYKQVKNIEKQQMQQLQIDNSGSGE